MTFLEGVVIFRLFVGGDLLTQRHEILSRNTRYSRLSYGKNPKSLFKLCLNRYRDVKDRQTYTRTDRQNCRS